MMQSAARNLIRRTIVTLSVVFALAAPNPSVADDTLRIGLLPSESAPDVVRKHRAFGEALSAALDRPIELIVGVDYSATAEALRFGRLDMAYLGPASFVLLSTRAEIAPLVRPEHPDGRSTFHSVVIVPSGNPTQTLEELRGTEIAFGDVASTSGHVVPRAMLLDAGLAAGKDYEPRYLGAHDAVALAVARGRVAAGGVSLPVLERLFAQGSIDMNKLRIIAYSEPIPEYAWVAAPETTESGIEILRRALLDMQEPEALLPFGAHRFVAAARADYDGIKSRMERLNLIAPASSR